MKTWIGVLALCLMMLEAALAQTYAFSDPPHSRALYTCEDFAGEMPDAAGEAFADVLREDDEIICGTIMKETWEGLEGEQSGTAMMAIRRGENMLLLGALQSHEDKRWRACVESDRFLPEGIPFTMTCRPDYSSRGVMRFVCMALDAGNEQMMIRASSGGMLYLHEYIRQEADGTKTVAAYANGMVDWGKRTDGKKDVIYGRAGPMPSRLCAWTYDTLPRSSEESQNWSAPLLFDLAQDEGYLSGVNLREQPTGQSESFGIYRARVKILGQQPGPDAPWYNVRVGNLEGWASGRYLKMEDEEGSYGLAVYQTTVSKVSRVKTDAELLDRPSGKAIMTLKEGTLVHAVMEHDGWLHVIVPRGEIAWQTDWDGTYGFVKSGDMTVGMSIADVIWRE